MTQIAVIGAGTMGNGIAHVFAQNGYEVNLIDISSQALDKALATIAKNMDRQIQKERLTESQKSESLERIKRFTDLQQGVADRDLIVEAATENEELKRKIFQQLDEFAPDSAILATNTSSISITKIAAATQRSSQVIGMHFMNPVPIMKLVEIIKGYDTTEEVEKKNRRSFGRLG